jgi:hypothetical protein
VTQYEYNGNDGFIYGLGQGATMPTNALGLAADNTYVYWTNNTSPPSVDLQGATNFSNGQVRALASGLPVSSAVAVYNLVLYWGGSNGTIYSVAVPNGSPRAIAASSSTPVAMAVDSSGVYWVSSDGTVWRAPLAGGTAVTLARGQGSPYAIALDANAVYWTNETGGQVMRMPK